ncbi:MAG TPA: T9SS type A sorting domain-containing protein [Flavobacteriales bacterium]|nr:T9SS type A sorting domain-containing protein [Flavobacteriales bacterium]
MALKLGAHCLLFVGAPRCEAQNLVPNHSFEEFTDCLEVNTAYTVETGPLGWFSAGGTGDYYLSCLPYGAFNGVPLSSWAFQYPQDGECYVGLVTYIQSTGVREYFMIQLAQPLVPGQVYYASFYANAAWNGSNAYPQHYLASSHVGMKYTTQPRPWVNGDSWPTGDNEAHVYHPWVIADTVGWTLVNGSFVADSAYQYLMIGNHFDNASTDTLHFATFAWTPRAYTLIDNVCVSPNPKGCPSALGVTEPGMDTVVLFPNPAHAEIALSGVPLGSNINIHDALGRLVWREENMGGDWRKNVLAWARGTYVLRLEQQGRFRSFKFVLIE